MASIGAATGSAKFADPPLALLEPSVLNDACNIVLLVVDGLGYEYLAARPGSNMSSALLGTMTSVFPTTTASAITTFLTGDAPLQHGVPGWFTYFDELDNIYAVLPFQRRGSPDPDGPALSAAELLGHRSIFDRIPIDTYSVAPSSIADSEFNRTHSGSADTRPYSTLSEFTREIELVVRESKARKYIYAYWPEFDGLAHARGIGSQDVTEHFEALDDAIGSLAKALTGTDTALLVTADHGFIDSLPEQRIEVQNHPEFAELLRKPLCGEPRVAYCYVRDQMHDAFRSYVETEFAGKAECYASRELLSAELFGLGNAHPKLGQRLGDFTLIMQGDYHIKDTVPGERPFSMIGMHGGLTTQELYVPLVLFNS